jgi:hypothetical protein
MKRWFLVGAAAGALTLLAIAALLVLGILIPRINGFTVARAQTPTGPGAGAPGGWGMMGGRGMMGGGYGPMHEYMVAAFAGQLGLTPEALQAKLGAGQTMWQVAEAQGFSQEEIQEKMLAARAEALEAAVAGGALTQEQADRMSQHMGQMGANGMGPGHCPGMGGAGSARRGPGWRWNDQPQE